MLENWHKKKYPGKKLWTQVILIRKINVWNHICMWNEIYPFYLPTQSCNWNTKICHFFPIIDSFEKKEFLRNACKQFSLVLVESWKRWVRMKLYSLRHWFAFQIFHTSKHFLFIWCWWTKWKEKKNKRQMVICPAMVLQIPCTAFTLLNPRWNVYINIPYDLKVQRSIVHLYSELSNIQGNVTTMYRQRC